METRYLIEKEGFEWWDGHQWVGNAYKAKWWETEAQAQHYLDNIMPFNEIRKSMVTEHEFM